MSTAKWQNIAGSKKFFSTICNYSKNNLRPLKINLDIIKFSRQKCDKIMF